MEIFNTIIQTFTTPDEWMSNIICSPLIIVEAIVNMLLFTTILSIDSNRKQKVKYVVLTCILCLFTKFIIPSPYGTIINMVLYILIIFKIFKIGLIKSLLAQILPLILTALIEPIIIKVFYIVFNVSYDIVAITPAYRMSAMLIIYAMTYITYFISKKFNLNIRSLDILDKSSKRLLLINTILGILAIAMQYYLVNFYSDNLPLLITIFSTLTLLIYFILSFYNITRTTKLELTKQDLEETKLYNKTLNLLYDNIRGFKHDFNNIVQAIGGYVQSEDIDGLKKYYEQILEDCDKQKNLSVLNPKVINNPAIYSILASKYYLAESKGITIHFDIFMDLNTIKMKIYEFTRILGILLDNAIEASSECEEKLINLIIRNEENKKRQILYIENTYSNKDIDTEKIFEKSYTTKSKNTGLGLWEVRQILKRNNNLNLFTNKNDKFFSQQLEIY